MREEVEKYIKFLKVGDERVIHGAHATTCPCPCASQAVERETEHADQVHAEELLRHQKEAEAHSSIVTEWKVKYFDEQYEK